MKKLILAALIGLLCWKGYAHYHPGMPALAPTEDGVAGGVRAALPVASLAPAAAYACDGRQHCSQMKSCEEAKYFLAHCPGVKMDGDNDGIPCEQQHCRGAPY